MKKHIKRLVSALVLLSIFGSNAVAATKNKVTVYTSESFEEFITNDIQGYFDVSGSADVIVTEVGKKNKALTINKKPFLYSSLSREFDPIEGYVFFQFDIKIEGERFPWSVSLKSKNGKTLTAIKEEGTGELFTGDRMKCGHVNPNKWVNVAIMYSPYNARYSVYIDGSIKLDNCILPDKSFDMPTSISFSMDAADNDGSMVYIDNFGIYSGKEVQKSSIFPKQKYNNDSIKYEETVITENKNIVSMADFNNKAGYPAAKDNIAEVREEDGNKFFHLEEVGTSDCFVDFISGLGTQYYVVYTADVRSSKYSGGGQIFQLKLKPNNVVSEMLSIKKGGNLTTYDGKVIGKLIRNRWHNISVVADFLKKEFDVYLDYEKVAETVPFANKTGGFASNLRFRLGGKSNNDLDIDNFAVYYGKEIKHIFDDSTVSGVSPDFVATDFWDVDTEVKEKIGDNLVYDAINSNTYFGGEKTLHDENGAIIENDINYLPILKTAERLGKEVKIDGKKYTYNDVAVEVGSSTMMIGGRGIALSAPVIERNGTAYAPADAFSVSGLLGEPAFSDSRGLVAFGFDDLNSETERSIANFVHYERPSAELLLADFEASGMRDVHPRILMNQEEFDRVKNTINTNVTAKEMFEKIKTRYESLNFPEMTYILQNGDRLLPVSEEVFKRVITLSFLYRITGEDKYAAKAYKEMEAAANFPDWHRVHYLDTAKLAQAISLGYDWLYDYMSEEQRSVIEKALREFSMKEYLRSYIMKEWWADDEANWALICNSGSLMTALALMEKYPEDCSQMLEIAIKGFENVMYSFGPDGAYHEGPSYWEASVENFELGLQTLTTALHKDYGIATAAGVDKTVDWARAISYKDKTFAYSDSGGVEVSLKVRNAMMLGYYYKRPEWQVVRMEAVNQGFIGGDLYEVYDLMWYVPEYVESGEKKTISIDTKYRDVEVGSTRSSFADDALAIMYKGGTARLKGHEHLDSGNFCLFQDGICWAKDYGYGAYNEKGYYDFSETSKPNRWNYYHNHTQGHNCILINPDEDSEVNPQDWRAMSRIVRFESKDKGNIGVLDLSETYAHKASSYQRGFMLADDRRSVTIRDEMVIPGSKNEIYWFMHTGIAGDENFEVNGNSMVVTHPSGEKLYIEFITNAEKAEIFTLDSDFLPSFKEPGKDNPIEGKKVAIKLTGGGNVNLTVKMYDADLMGMLPSVDDTPISAWTIPDGELVKAPILTGLYKDGAMIENFNDNLREYNLEVHYDEEFPEITASAPEGTHIDLVKIPIDDENMEYKIKVSLDSDAGFYSNYTVKIKKVPYTYKTFDDYIRLYPIETTASRVPELHNPPQSVNDNNFETRFAVDGDNEWIQLDYGSVVEADAYAIAYYKGTERISYYDILISEDGVNYETIYQGGTSGLTNEFELFKTGRIKLRYLKLVGHKTTAGDWNSPTEIALLVAKEE